MKKLITLIVTIVMMFCCLSCKVYKENISINKNFAFEKVENNIFYYNTDGQKKMLVKSDLETEESQIIYEQDADNYLSFSIINDKIYYFDSYNLYSKPLNNLTDESTIEGTVTKNDVKLIPGNYNGSFNIFNYGDYIYIQGRALYRIENSSINEVLNDITSYYINDDEFYYGDSKGNIYKTDVNIKESQQLVSAKQLEEINNQYISILGGLYCINDLQLYKDKIYFLVTAGISMPGKLFYYDLQTREINIVDKMQDVSVNSFAICQDILVCYGSTAPYTNALFTIEKNNINIVSPYVSGFAIKENKIYYYDIDNRTYMESSISARKSQKLLEI